LVSLITLADLAYETQNIRINNVRSADPVPLPFLYINTLIFYLVLAQIIVRLFKVAERRSARRFGSA
jgi:ABC-type amino acid transport system permease subunit